MKLNKLQTVYTTTQREIRQGFISLTIQSEVSNTVSDFSFCLDFTKSSYFTVLENYNIYFGKKWYHYILPLIRPKVNIEFVHEITPQKILEYQSANQYFNFSLGFWFDLGVEFSTIKDYWRKEEAYRKNCERWYLENESKLKEEADKECNYLINYFEEISKNK
jgi:hypothetical protein